MCSLLLGRPRAIISERRCTCLPIAPCSITTNRRQATGRSSAKPASNASRSATLMSHRAGPLKVPAAHCRGEPAPRLGPHGRRAGGGGPGPRPRGITSYHALTFGCLVGETHPGTSRARACPRVMAAPAGPRWPVHRCARGDARARGAADPQRQQPRRGPCGDPRRAARAPAPPDPGRLRAHRARPPCRGPPGGLQAHRVGAGAARHLEPRLLVRRRAPRLFTAADGPCSRADPWPGCTRCWPTAASSTAF